jgi:hypothetical protein
VESIKFGMLGSWPEDPHCDLHRYVHPFTWRPTGRDRSLELCTSVYIRVQPCTSLYILRLFYAPASATKVLDGVFTPWTMYPFPIPDSSSIGHAGLLLRCSWCRVESHSRALWVVYGHIIRRRHGNYG